MHVAMYSIPNFGGVCSAREATKSEWSKKGGKRKFNHALSFHIASPHIKAETTMTIVIAILLLQRWYTMQPYMQTE